MSGFEGSFLGDSGRIDAATVMECGVCWWVYDPSVGDEVWQIAPGTAFADLPSHWRCPRCDAAQSQFMVLHARDEIRTAEKRDSHEGRADPRARSREVANAYRRVAARMRDLPVYNSRLDVHVTTMRRSEHGWVCVASTPWSMNLLLVPVPVGNRAEGTSRELVFPSGTYSFTRGHLAGVGAVETCSLFSPMEVFEEPAAVEAVAEHAIEQLFAVADCEPTASTGPVGDATMSRRRFLRPGTRT